MKETRYDINTLFRKRVGLSKNEVITFEKLVDVLEKAAKTIPFENLCIIANQTSDLSKEGLINKIFIRNEGGLCYELNLALHFFLIENGFKTSLVRGVIFNHIHQQWNPIGRTHVANILSHHEELYLIDTGFGGNLPLKPVPLKGEGIASNNGHFRVKKFQTEYGDYIFEMQLKHKDNDWKIGYAFDSKKTVKNLNELNEIKNIIEEHEKSPFNKTPLITKITDSGNITLTDTSFTEWINGKVVKEDIDEKNFKEILHDRFSIRSF